MLFNLFLVFLYLILFSVFSLLCLVLLPLTSFYYILFCRIISYSSAFKMNVRCVMLSLTTSGQYYYPEPYGPLGETFECNELYNNIIYSHGAFKPH
ncbi:hypothetical protein HBI46_145320 [Parastagonospora nodorum]|nr:hypothetical protein HBH51_197290 [Parastagonospora nodorum]KAH4104184.1 hypothetical protein HBH46_102400 [Parastagonospora nodorum]KAH4240315.1 hypothetical protein HBI05_106810 [Parastagonospora nodorum]KAH4686713.1 hypothetical protein HBH78_109680 [Parastagonospora nodorum]KAH5013726.1 hypothetical protein HBI75_191330 [Parastagonospora nodorum]